MSQGMDGGKRLVPTSKDGRIEEPFCAAWVTEEAAATLQALAPADDEPWGMLAKRSPIEHRVAEAAEATPLDEALDQDLKHLEAVFRRPRQSLRTTQERVPLAQARRVPDRAVQALVSHPEDWERRTAMGIQPLRVLAQFSEDDLDLYENRAAVRLLRGLLEYVHNRIYHVTERLHLVREGDERDSSQGNNHGGHWRNERVYALFGEFFGNDANDSRKALEGRLLALQSVRQRLLCCQDRPLYRAVDARAADALGEALKPTNILINDPDYRKVAHLWRAWIHYARRDEGAEARALRRQQESEGFDRFVRILVIRALQSLAWKESTNDALTPGSTIVITRDCARATLRFEVDGSMELSCGERRLRIAPVLCGLSSEGIDEVQRDLVAHCGRQVPELDIIVALLDQAGARADDPGQPSLRASSPLLAGWGIPTTILVSPTTLDSQERVERALNVWLTQRVLPEFGSWIPVTGLPDASVPNWLQRVDREGRPHVASIRPPSQSEVESLRQQVRELQRLAAKGSGGRPQDQAALRKIDEAIERVIQSAANLRPWTDCPLCHHSGKWEPRVESSPWTWWCRCPKCDSEWGTRACGKCRKAYPVLHPGHLKPPPIDQRDHDWPNLAFGRDLWSQPCSDAEKWGVFRCCHCGSCGNDTCRCATER